MCVRGVWNCEDYSWIIRTINLILYRIEIGGTLLRKTCGFLWMTSQAGHNRCGWLPYPFSWRRENNAEFVCSILVLNYRKFNVILSIIASVNIESYEIYVRIFSRNYFEYVYTEIQHIWNVAICICGKPHMTYIIRIRVVYNSYQYWKLDNNFRIYQPRRQKYKSSYVIKRNHMLKKILFDHQFREIQNTLPHILLLSSSVLNLFDIYRAAFSPASKQVCIHFNINFIRKSIRII